MKFPLRYDAPSGYVVDALGAVIACWAGHTGPGAAFIAKLNAYHSFILEVAQRLDDAGQTHNTTEFDTLIDSARQLTKDTP